MEGIVTLVIIYVIWSVVSGYFKRKKQEKILKTLVEDYQREIRENPFQVKAYEVEESISDDNDTELDFLKVDIKGIINVPTDNYDTTFIVKMFDVTDGEEDIILCTTEHYQANDSGMFWYEENEVLPYEGTIFKNWVTQVRVPKIFLELPRRGNRKVKIEIFVCDKNRKILEEDSTVIDYYNEYSGYLDDVENRHKFEEAVIKTALIVSGSDGDMDESEANVVKEWVKKRISGYKKDYQEETKQRLNNYIKDSYGEVINGEIGIYDSLIEIDEIASEGEKYELFEVCLKVASADGTADEEELKIIDEIAEELGLNRKKFQSMIEKELPVTIHASKTTSNDSGNGNKHEKMLGITSDMSNDEIKKHLRREYTKWNSRVSNSDPAIREQAEEMIKIISELRTKYK